MGYYDFEDFFVGAGVGLIILFIFLLLIGLAVIVFQLICTWKVYKKAGKAGWEAIVPFYNTWVLNEIAGLNWWWFLISISGVIVAALSIPGLSQLASLASLFANINMSYNLCKKFKKDGGFFVLLALIPVVGYAILAFDQKVVYDSSVEVSNNGFINATASNGTTSTANNASAKKDANAKFCHNCGAKIDGDSKFCNKCGTNVDE